MLLIIELIDFYGQLDTHYRHVRACVARMRDFPKQGPNCPTVRSALGHSCALRRPTGTPESPDIRATRLGRKCA